MVFQTLPSSGPLLLARQETSPLFEFFVPNEAEKVFIRMIALFRDNEPLGGEAPTFQIRAGSGMITSVGPDSGEVSVPHPSGVGNSVGKLRCQREPKDIYLITISDIVENSGPWKLRIRNNDAEPLRFVGFNSHRERDTLQPWMRLGNPNTSFISYLEFQAKRSIRTIEVRNWGTAPLTFADEPGPIGGRDSDFILKSRPARVDPHQVDGITIEAQSDTRTDFTHQFSCNDTIEGHANLSLAIRPFIKPPKESKETPDGPGKTLLDRKGSYEFVGRSGIPLGAEKNVTDRLAGLEQTVAQLVHFISPDLRPDLSQSALAHEEQQFQGEVRALSDRLRQQANEAKDAKDAKDLKDLDNKLAER
jgi:hypothetical protein